MTRRNLEIKRFVLKKLVTQFFLFLLSLLERTFWFIHTMSVTWCYRGFVTNLWKVHNHKTKKITCKRSSHRRCSIKKMFWKILRNSQESGHSFMTSAKDQHFGPLLPLSTVINKIISLTHWTLLTGIWNPSSKTLTMKSTYWRIAFFLC